MMEIREYTESDIDWVERLRREDVIGARIISAVVEGQKLEAVEPD
jgi:hypothetical protein